MRIASRVLEGCAVIAALVSPSANAATITWINVARGSYTNGSYWSTGTVPASADDVVFNQTINYNVISPTDSNRTYRTALIDGGAVTFNLDGKLTTPSARVGFMRPGQSGESWSATSWSACW